MPTRELCMQKAAKLLDGYLARNGGWEVQTTDWVVYGWDFEPGDNDVVVMCPILRGDLVNALMVIHGEDLEGAAGEAADARREAVAAEIDALWRG